jgi:hypothetical protein
MSKASRRSIPVTSFIEEFFSAPLDPGFVVSATDIKSEIIVNLFEAYQQFTESFSAGTIDARELAPVNHHFPRFYSDRDPFIADKYLRRAMSQLLYAHRCAFVDTLGYNLARWSHPVKEHEAVIAWDSEPKYRVGLQNYFETLMFLRPLIDVGLVDILPFVPDRDLPNPGSNEISFGNSGPYLPAFKLASEVVYGTEYRRRLDRMLAEKGQVFIQAGPEEQEQELEDLEDAFAALIVKLRPPWVKAGDLSLETPHEMRALRYLLSTCACRNLVHVM